MTSVHLKTYDVAIIGGGLAGLAAAAKLKEIGISWIGLEASERLSGRVQSRDCEGGTFDAGAQFFNQDMARLHRIVSASGSQIFVAPAVETKWLSQRGRRYHEYKDVEQSVTDTFEYLRSSSTHLLKEKIDSGYLENKSVLDLLYQLNLTDTARRFCASIMEEIFCADPALVHAQNLIDSFERYRSNRDDMECWLPNGMEQAVRDWQRHLNLRFQLGERVRAIHHKKDHSIIFATNFQYKARYVIVCVPPPLVTLIDFDPQLPSQLISAFAAYQQGFAYKALLIAKIPVKRFNAYFENPRGVSIHNLSLSGSGRLVLHAGGRYASRLCNSDRQSRIQSIESLVRPIFEPASDLIVADEQIWSANKGQGGYFSHLACQSSAWASVIIKEGAHRTSFASSELAPEFRGFAEGALAAGEMAAYQAQSRIERY